MKNETKGQAEVWRKRALERELAALGEEKHGTK